MHITKRVEYFQVHTASVLGPARGERSGREEYILNGTPAAKGQFPFQAGVVIEGDFCGGSLINKNWVLTAAKCVKPFYVEWTVYLGAHNISIVREPGRLILTSRTAIAYDGFDIAFIDNDIALILLPEDVKFNGQSVVASLCDGCWGAFDSAKNYKHQRRKRQSVTAKREKSQTPNFV